MNLTLIRGRLGEGFALNCMKQLYNWGIEILGALRCRTGAHM